MAKWTQKKMKEFGLLDSKVHIMDSLLSYPVSRHLELNDEHGNVQFRAPLSEKPLEMDPTSNTIWRNMTFLAYTPSGEVLNKKLVYANYGKPEDFDVLESEGIDVMGKVVIVRYGKCFRGLKIMNAQRRGAIGLLLYSDPLDDGYRVGKVYPDGPWRPETSVQRGSAQFNSLCPGDPQRAHSEATTEQLCGYKPNEVIPSIPAIPISYHDAIPLLLSLQGDEVPPDWVGGLTDKLVYRFGPSKGTVSLGTNNTFKVTPIWNVITTIKGTLPKELDQPVVLGNHRDAWVYGAADPNSGSTVMLEVGRAFGKLVQSGWKPKRTIIIASWSGEEYGLVGSTGWGEEYANTLLKNATVYINVDVGVSGKTFASAATHSLGRELLKVAGKVKDPETQKPLSDVWDKQLGTLGSGSDYTVFLDNLGIASYDLRFMPFNKQPYGTYHSIYDSYTWIETQADPTLEYHVLLSQVVGLLALDFADLDVLPIELQDEAQAISQYVDELEGMHIHGLDELRKAVKELEKSAVAFARNDEVDNQQKNRILGLFERNLLDKEGLPKRKWFKHILQAPGLYLGYEPEVFPGIQQAFSEKNNTMLQQEITRAVSAINRGIRMLTPQNSGEPFVQAVY
uniref:Peptidase M28 domain-containing protein n=1 Tax=Aplanochytrium stocchinoi TaxID=215587 RepID=A0A7S3LRD1_9STRA